MKIVYASLYPSVIREFNIAPHTQIGMIIIPDKIHNKENVCKLDDRWTRAGAFAEDMISQVWTEVGHRWFGLADYETLYHEVEFFYQSKAMAYNGLRTYNRQGLIEPMIFGPENGYIEPMIFDDTRRIVEDKYIVPNLDKWEAWRVHATKYPNQFF